MKTLFLVLAVVVGFGLGWMVGCGGLQTERSVAAFPFDEIGFEKVATILAEMEESEVRALLENIQRVSVDKVRGFDHRTLWQASTAFHLLSTEQAEGPIAAREHAQALIAEFRENYEKGMDLGDFAFVARNLYENTDDVLE